MSRNAKIGIGVVAGLVVLCVCVCGGGLLATSLFGGQWVKNNTTTDPAKVQSKAQQIIDFQLPPGYSNAGAFSFFYANMVFFSNPENNTDIMIMGINSGSAVDADQLRQQMQQQMQRTVAANLQVVDRQTMTIRGQQVTVTTAEGKTADGTAMRQVTTDPFTGKSGLVLITITGEVNNWPEEDINNFLTSIQ